MVYGREPATVSSQVVDLLMVSSDHQNSCLGHVLNLAEVDVMTHITKIAAVETSTAIWEYDPSLPDNRVLNGSLDVIAAIRTIAIKVRCVAIKYLGSLTCHRFSLPGNVSKRSKSFKLNAEFKTHSKYHFTAMFGGVLHIACSV